MKTVTSVSGGQTSAYLAANFPTDFNVFALVRTDDPKCRFKDRTLAARVEDRIQKPFVGTLEDDTIIQTIFDLEQFIGRSIDWVSGVTYDEAIKKKAYFLPNGVARYCTTLLKLDPIFYWWADVVGEPVEMRIGFRANEMERAEKMKSRLNADGLDEYKATFEKNARGLNKWEMIPWRTVRFPLIENQVYKDNVSVFWRMKPVQFAPLNNCVGCFHRNELLLNKMFGLHPEKMQWFADQETKNKGTFKPGVNYEQIKNHRPQYELDFSDFSDCDSGFCGV